MATLASIPERAGGGTCFLRTTYLPHDGEGSRQKVEGAPGSAPLPAVGVSSGGTTLISQGLSTWGPDPVSRTEWGEPLGCQAGVMVKPC